MSVRKLMLLGASLWGSFVMAAQSVFVAEYDVYWRDWPCGSMHSELIKQDNDHYLYQQTIKSSVWFFAFQQQESSDFFVMNQQIQPLKYIFWKEQGSSGMHYTVEFDKEQATLTYLEANPPAAQHFSLKQRCFDRLSLQLQLMLSMTEESRDHFVMPHLDRHGVQDCRYDVRLVHDQEVEVASIQRNRKNVFILDKNNHYVPSKFEQLKNGKPILSGVLRTIEFDESAWKELKEKILYEKTY